MGCRIMSHGNYKRTMVNNRTTITRAQKESRRQRATSTQRSRNTQWYIMGITNRSTLERYSRSIPTIPNMPSAIPVLDTNRCVQYNTGYLGQRFERSWQDRYNRMLHRWYLCRCEKRGLSVGKTKRGKGTKIMAIADGSGLPLSISIASASPHEVTLVNSTIQNLWIDETPERLIGDKAYDSDKLDKQLKEDYSIELIAPHKSNRQKKPTQDGRVLRRYCRRWRVERLFAWLHNFRRIIIRYEFHVLNYLSMVMLGCIIILLRQF